MKKELLEIAKKHSIDVQDRGDLEYRGNDAEDFIEVMAISLKDMLEEAYELGKKDGKRK